MNRESVIVTACLHDSCFKSRLHDWLRDDHNWRIWMKFEAEANAAWNKGRRHYSARTIGEYIRHDSVLTDSDPNFKVNDHAWPDLARLYLAVYPERAGFFELREAGRKVA